MRLYCWLRVLPAIGWHSSPNGAYSLLHQFWFLYLSASVLPAFFLTCVRFATTDAFTHGPANDDWNRWCVLARAVPSCTMVLSPQRVVVHFASTHLNLLVCDPVVTSLVLELCSGSGMFVSASETVVVARHSRRWCVLAALSVCSVYC